MWEYNHDYSDELYHWGIKGMRWGVRRFQKKDGSLTPAGRKRYITVAEGKLRAEAASTRAKRQAYKDLNESPKKHTKFQYDKAANKAGQKARRESIDRDREANQKLREERAKKREEFKLDVNDVRMSRTTGSKIALNLLAGPFANRTYNSLVAAGNSGTTALIGTAGAAMLGGPLGHIVVSSIVADNVSKRN